jgi:3-dehydroquinate synthase
VALGMVAALELGATLGVGPRALAQRAVALLARLSLPVDLARRLDADVMSRVTVDKKRRGSTIRFVLCPKPGETLLRDLTPTEIAAGLGAPEA